MLERLVSALLDMESAVHFEIVVVEETDQPVPVEGVTYITHPQKSRGIPYARNLALKHVLGEIVVFLDDDCLIINGWLDNLLDPFSDNTVIGVQGGVIPPEGTNAIGWAEAMLGFPGGNIARIYRSQNKLEQTQEISTLNCAYRKWVLDAIGGFDESLSYGGEDYVLAKEACRHGVGLFVPRAAVTHQARGGLKKIWHWFIRRGRADIDVIRTRKTLRTYLSLLKSSLAVKLSLLIFVLLIFKKFASVLLILCAALYISVNLKRYFIVWKKSRKAVSVLFMIPVVKLIMDIAGDCGRIMGLAFGKTRYRHIQS